MIDIPLAKRKRAKRLPMVEDDDIGVAEDIESTIGSRLLLNCKDFNHNKPTVPLTLSAATFAQPLMKL